MKQFTPEQKHEILLEYTPYSRTHSFASLAARHAVAGGEEVVRRWHQQWDRTPASLQHKPVSGRPHSLTEPEVQRYIATPIRKKNRAAQQVRYTTVAEQLRERTGKSVSDRTVRRIGKEELGIRKTRGRKRTADESNAKHTQRSDWLLLFTVYVLMEVVCCCARCSVSAEACEQIAKMRRKLQRIGIHHILFLDETHKREGDVETYTLVLPGESPYIATSSTSSYSTRYDMIACCCCSGATALPPIIYTPKERERGINQEMLLDYARNLLAQAAGALDVYPLILVVDRSGIHNEAKIIQEFHDWGCQELTQVIRMPTAAAKRLSPLDNSLFNLWRQRVLASGPLTKSNIKPRMSDAWNSITAADIKRQYRHCGLLRGQNVYFDCPNPTAHRHHS
jgi:transposase